jgi:Cu/Ag efflux protein CusF
MDRGERAMRTLLALLASLALLTATVAPVLAQGTSSSRAQDMKTVSGTVKSTTRDGFVVTSKEDNKDREYAFSVDEKTMVRKGTQPGAPGDLRPGDRVTVNFAARDGKSLAHTVTVARP